MTAEQKKYKEDAVAESVADFKSQAMTLPDIAHYDNEPILRKYKDRVSVIWVRDSLKLDEENMGQWEQLLMLDGMLLFVHKFYSDLYCVRLYHHHYH